MMILRLALTALLSSAASAYQAGPNDAMTKFVTETPGENLELESLRSKFFEWVTEHEKNYDSAEEALRRMTIWFENHEFIEQHNNQVPKPSYTLGHNHFSDLTNEEFRKLHRLGEFSPSFEIKKDDPQTNLRGPASEQAIERDLVDDGEILGSIDWVDNGAVGEVKNQGQCGACWAFSTTGAIEGALFLKTGKLVELSEQHLIDCDTTKQKGCDGGLMDTAFKYDENTEGICLEKDYKYVEAKQDKCLDNCTPEPGTIVDDYVDIDWKNSVELKKGLSKQPVSVAIQADQIWFQFYRGGVYDNKDCGAVVHKDDCNKDMMGNCIPPINHGVLAVGYGVDAETGMAYWKVKNSWGPNWGEDGFIRLYRDDSINDPYNKDVDNQWGTCAILTLESYPILKD